MTRPVCPQCQGSRVVKVGGSRTSTMPCSSCDDGYMRGIDDPTPEERALDVLMARIADAEAAGFEAGRRRAAEDAARGCEDFAKGIRDTLGRFPISKANAGRIDAALTLAKLIRASVKP